MKQLPNISLAFKKCLSITVLLLFQMLAWAQDKKVDIDLNVNEKKDDWYMQPWVWVVAGAIFIIILVGLLRGRGTKN